MARLRFFAAYAITTAAIAAFVIFSAPPARAQVLYGSIAGAITDQSGRVIPGAAVSVINANAGLARNTTSALSVAENVEGRLYAATRWL